MLALFGCQERHYIAHAGGNINTHMYSNSLEAVQHALENNIEYIEWDLSITSDGQLVAWHDWQFEWTEAPTHNAFMARKIYGAFTPLDFARMDSILKDNPQLILVTDKISDPEIINQWWHNYKDRMWVECFRDEDYFALEKMGYHVMRSQVPPLISEAHTKIRNYVFNYQYCPVLSDRYGDCFALFGGVINETKADSLFSIDKRIQMVYIDFYD